MQGALPVVFDLGDGDNVQRAPPGAFWKRGPIMRGIGDPWGTDASIRYASAHVVANPWAILAQERFGTPPRFSPVGIPARALFKTQNGTPVRVLRWRLVASGTEAAQVQAALAP